MRRQSEVGMCETVSQALIFGVQFICLEDLNLKRSIKKYLLFIRENNAAIAQVFRDRRNKKIKDSRLFFSQSGDLK
jgi:hypothetical protein